MQIEIHACRTKATRFWENRCDAYEFRPDLPKRWHWLQKIAIGVLKKLGAFQRFPRTEVQRIRIDTDDIIEAAKAQIGELLRADLQPGVILMGFGQIDSMRECFMEYMYFNADVYIGHAGEVRLLDIPVHTIPHMDGILVLPDKPHQVIDAVMGRRGR